MMFENLFAKRLPSGLDIVFDPPGVEMRVVDPADPYLVHFKYGSDPGAHSCQAVMQTEGKKLFVALIHLTQGGVPPANTIEHLAPALLRKFYPKVRHVDVEWFVVVPEADFWIRRVNLWCHPPEWANPGELPATLRAKIDDAVGHQRRRALMAKAREDEVYWSTEGRQRRRLTSSSGIAAEVGLIWTHDHSGPAFVIDRAPAELENAELFLAFPVIANIYRLPSNYHFQTPEFREVCGVLGFDPDALLPYRS